MTIADKAVLDKGASRLRPRRLLGGIPKAILILALILLCSGAAFALGRLYEREEGNKAEDTALWIENLPAEHLPAAAAALEGMPAKPPTSTPMQPRASTSAAIPAGGGEVVASKNGTAYYLPSCSGASRINPENLVRFPSKEAAEAKGYKPAKTCKGL